MSRDPLIKACVFDAFGTIFDLSSATARSTVIPDDKRSALTMLWRDKQLQYTWLRSLQGQYVDFEQVTRDALEFALDTLNLSSPSMRDDLMNLYFSLSAFPEVEPVLRRLKESGMRTALLSNGTPKMLDSLIKHNQIGHLFDFVLSCDDVKIFKTHPRVYEYCLQRLDLNARDISFQSSNAWDAYAASSFGMRVIWCNRYDQKPERLPGQPDFEVKTLRDLPELIARYN